MNKNIMKALGKGLIFGGILAVALYFLGTILVKKDMFKEIESAFIFEGMISIIIGLFSAMSGNLVAYLCRGLEVVMLVIFLM